MITWIFSVIRTFVRTLFSLMWLVISTLWELRFPLKWVNSVSRTVLYGMITFVSVCYNWYQFLSMCKTKQAFEALRFSNRFDGAQLDLVLPKELYESISQSKNNNSSDDGAPAAVVKKKYPVIVMYSGGAWIIGRRLWMRPLVVHMADAGFISIVPDYQQFPGAAIPEMVQDVVDSLSWVFDQIGQPGSPLEHADPDRVIALGQSAGAHVCSIALLQLAKLRKQQMAELDTLQQPDGGGIAPPSRYAYLRRSKLRGVPAAFVGVSGLFDLVTTAPLLHEKGLHKYFFKKLCNNEHVAAYCARRRSTAAAVHARDEFVPLIAENSNSGGYSNSNNFEDFFQSPTTTQPYYTKNQQQQGNNNGSSRAVQNQQQQQQKTSFSSAGEVSDRRDDGSGEAGGGNNTSTPTRRRFQQPAASTRTATTSHQPQGLDTNHLSVPHPHHQRTPSKDPSSFASLLPDAPSPSRGDATVPTSVHYLPRFNLFMHGDRDTSAPLEQAQEMAAAFNDAAARHADELIGDDVVWTKQHVPAHDPFYFLTARPKFGSPLAKAKLRYHYRTRSQQSSATFSADDSSIAPLSPIDASPVSAVSTAAGGNNGECGSSGFLSRIPPPPPPLRGQQETSDSKCDCFEGNRSIFMSYRNGTHTSLVVEDFFRKGYNPPLVVAVLALLKSLDDISGKHEELLATTPLLLPNSSNDFGMMRSCATAQCTHRRSASSMTEVAALHPERVALPANALVSLFEQHYRKFDKMELRNPVRAVCPEFLLWLAATISAF